MPSTDYQVINNCGSVNLTVTYKKDGVSGDQTVSVSPHPTGNGGSGSTETAWRKILIDVEEGTTVRVEQQSAQESGSGPTITLDKISTPIVIEFEHTTSGGNGVLEVGDDE